MNATETKQSNTKIKAKRDRRHWYDHEKLDIIKRFDSGDLLPIPGDPLSIEDPKSKKELAILAVEGWRSQFKKLGILKGKAAEPHRDTGRNVGIPIKLAKTSDLQNLLKDEDNVQSLLIQVLMENQKLKRALKTPGSNSKKQSTKVDELEASL